MYFVIIKGTTRGLSGVFLPLVMNPRCPLKYYDRSITSPWFAIANVTHLYGKNHSGCCVMLLDPWMSPSLTLAVSSPTSVLWQQSHKFKMNCNGNIILNEKWHFTPHIVFLSRFLIWERKTCGSHPRVKDGIHIHRSLFFDEFRWFRWFRHCR